MSVLSRLITGGPGVQFRDIDPDHEGIHVIGSGGAPQTEPGPECRKWSIPLIGGGEPPGRGLAWCAGCRGAHRLLLGFDRIARHQPSPPTIDQCPYCGRPYPELRKGQKSYTDPECRECAAAHDERDIEAAGFVPTASEQETR